MSLPFDPVIVQRVGAMTLGNTALHFLGRLLIRGRFASASAGDRLYLAELLPSTVHCVVLAGTASYLLFVKDEWRCVRYERRAGKPDRVLRERAATLSTSAASLLCKRLARQERPD